MEQRPIAALEPGGHHGRLGSERKPRGNGRPWRIGRAPRTPVHRTHLTGGEAREHMPGAQPLLRLAERRRIPPCRVGSTEGINEDAAVREERKPGEHSVGEQLHVGTAAGAQRQHDCAVRDAVGMVRAHHGGSLGGDPLQLARRDDRVEPRHLEDPLGHGNGCVSALDGPGDRFDLIEPERALRQLERHIDERTDPRSLGTRQFDRVARKSLCGHVGALSGRPRPPQRRTGAFADE